MSITDSLRRLIHSPAFKFILVMVLILALTIPLLFAFLLVNEREKYAQQARNDVGQMWGSAQTIRGPYVVVPTTRVKEVRRGDTVERVTVREFAILLPEDLKIRGQVTSEVRRRGIFEIPVYRSVIRFDGKFIQPITRALTQANLEIQWGDAALVLTMNDVRGIKKTAELIIDNGAERQLFRGGVSADASGRTQGIHVPITEAQAQNGFAFSFELHLNGSSAMRFVPAGGETEVTIKSDWPHPSFSGAFLPDQRDISDAGFSATWTIPRLARGQGQTIRQNRLDTLMQSKSFGVDFYQPVRFYSLAERALKYALGFIGIIFLAVFVMEIQSRKRVHWIQYIFVGLALVIFYLVLIGTAEHIGFDLGYLAAATATSILVGSYFGTVVRSLSRGLSLTGVLAVIYGLLYLLLRVEDYAMLIGSIAAFTLLAIVMFATRDVDWSQSADQEKAVS
ncbi:MAG: cell envelope integrity protein CreD [Hyphomicrobiaceae bacterium]